MSIEVTAIRTPEGPRVVELAIGVISLDVAIASLEFGGDEYRLQANGRSHEPFRRFPPDLFGHLPPDEEVVRAYEQRARLTSSLVCELIEASADPVGPFPVIVANNADIHYETMMLGFGVRMWSLWRGNRSLAQSVLDSAVIHHPPIDPDQYSLLNNVKKYPGAYIVDQL
jgi:hypothetical protein